MMRKRGFSLIEVLIAVTVLALGLLGLAAVFPVVVGQQRDAANASDGEAVVSGVRSYLESHETLNTFNRGWGALNTPSNLGVTSRRWVMLTDVSDPAAPMTWNALAGTDITIPLSERLWPSSSAIRPGGPRFVWDVAALAPDTTLTPPDDAGLVRAAVFVRPVDTNIRDRADPGASVWSLISGSSPQRVPVSEDNDGVPTRDGTGTYAELFGFEAEVRNYKSGAVWDRGDDVPADGLIITAVSDSIGRSTREATDLFTRSGQRIVDRHGNVFRITASKVLPDNTVLLRIDPPVPDFVSRSDDDERDVSSDDINPMLGSSIAPVVDPLILEIRP